MIKCFGLVVAVLLHSTLFAQSEESIDTCLDRMLKKEGLVGASWSTIDNGMITTGALGLKNHATGEPLNAANKIQIGSITKTIVATGILRLVTQKKLYLSTPVDEILPDISFDNPWKQNRRVLLEDLLNHTSGLEDARFWQVFSLAPQAETPLQEVFTKDPSVLKIRSKPGTRFSYSNMGYTLLGLVIERITNEPYEKYLDKHLLGPLGMSNSTFQFVNQKNDRDLAMGHFDNGATQESVPMYLRPAGQFTTTAYDMALLANFLMSDGQLNGSQFIQTDLLRAMGKPKTTESSRNGLNTGYQYGLSYRDRYEVGGFYHSGNVIGYRATLYLFPEQKKAFFISINTDSESADYQRFNKMFVDHLKIPKLKNLKSGVSSLNLAELEGYYVLNPIRFNLFAYLDMVFNSIKVSVEGSQGGLRIASLQNDDYQLFPVEKNFFRKQDRTRTSHVIYQKDDRYIVTDGLATYEETSAAYLLALWVSLSLGIIGMLLVIVRGTIGVVKSRNVLNDQVVSIPFLSILMLFVPVPFFFMQSFMEIGDPTLGNVLLTIVTGALPLAVAFGIYKGFSVDYRLVSLDLCALALFLQWLIILAYWGLIPFRLWAL